MHNPSPTLLTSSVPAIVILMVLAACEAGPVEPAPDLISGQEATVLAHAIDEIDIEPGGEGCTPGFWRQPHHFHHWPDGTSPDRVISGDHFGDMTFLDGLTARGGGLNALLRHAVAAFLNASHPDVDLGLTSSQVRSGFFEAVESGDYEPTKDIFESLNEQGCPLSGRPHPHSGPPGNGRP